MDTTKEYIEKLIKAPEIQKKWIPQNGDFVWHPDEGAEYMGTSEFPEKIDIVSLSDSTKDWWYNWLWLPGQDQLQELHGWKFNNQAIKFWEWGSEFNPETKDLFSWEQLWLAFVMKEKYNKIWNGKDWIIKGCSSKKERRKW